MDTSNIFESKNVEETEQIAIDFLNKLEKNVIGLKGNLGSGKTAFTKFVGKALGVKETIQSPTFVIQKSYDTTHPIFKKLYHFDLYRIEDANELKMFNLNEIFENKSNLVLIEWPEKAEQRATSPIFPSDMIYINFEFIDENTRKISY